MSDISALSPTASPAAPPGARPVSDKAESAGSVIASDFETFLRMLTTQLQNQDPFNPMNSSEFAVQVATFSGVEQQVRTNTLLEDMAQSMGGSDLGRYGSWIGMEARVEAPAMFDGTPITVYPASPRDGADAVQLVVRNEAGREVARLPVETGGSPVVWNGTGPTGQPLPAGIYSFFTESFSGGLPLGADAAATWGRIGELRSSATGVVAVLPGGGEVDIGAITALRTPPAASAPVIEG